MTTRLLGRHQVIGAFAVWLLSAPIATAQWIVGGNTLTALGTIGSNNNWPVAVEVNNTNRMFFATAAPNTFFTGIGPFSSTLLPRASLHVHSTISDANNNPFATFQLTNSTSTANSGRGIITTLSNTSGTLLNREGRMGIYGNGGIQFGGALNTNQMTILASGFVGIGTTNPQQLLHVKGGFGLIDGANAALCFGAASTGVHGEYLIEYDVSTDPLNTVYGLNFAKPGTSASGLRNFVMYLNDQGNIGMGVLPSKIDNTFRLSVNGRVRATEIVVESGWADYVFADDYELMPLNEVAAFIEREGHLPGVPSAEEVQECGVAVGEGQAMLLAKIEELTLYLLDQKAHIAELEKRLEQVLSDR